MWETDPRGDALRALKVRVMRFLHNFGLLVPTRDVYVAYDRIFSPRVRWSNYRFRQQWPTDMPPLPPPHLIYLVTGQYRIEPFLANGELGSACIRQVLSKNGLDIEAFPSILDFGCGCSRVMRHWNRLRNPQLYGTDYNPSLIEWCRGALPFAEFSVNALDGPLPYNNSQFDFVYGISVLTHLTVDQQQMWMRELWRVLKPGAHLYVTVHGFMKSEMTAEEQESFAAGNPVVFAGQYAGSNICTAFCPEPYMRNVLAKDFTVVDYVPLGAKDAGQDVYLLQKPHAGRDRP